MASAVMTIQERKNMARYLIGTALTLKGVPKKRQPADKFRKLLIRQKIPFTERGLDPLVDRIDLELKNGAWDQYWRKLAYEPSKSWRQFTRVYEFRAIEFTFDDAWTL